MSVARRLRHATRTGGEWDEERGVSGDGRRAWRGRACSGHVCSDRRHGAEARLLLALSAAVLRESSQARACCQFLAIFASCGPLAVAAAAAVACAPGRACCCCSRPAARPAAAPAAPCRGPEEPGSLLLLTVLVQQHEQLLREPVREDGVEPSVGTRGAPRRGPSHAHDCRASGFQALIQDNLGRSRPRRRASCRFSLRGGWETTQRCAPCVRSLVIWIKTNLIPV